MKRLATLTLEFIRITGCNAIKPNMEETQLLSKEIEKRIYAQARPTKAPETTTFTTTSSPASTPNPLKKPQPEAPLTKIMEEE